MKSRVWRILLGGVITAISFGIMGALLYLNRETLLSSLGDMRVGLLLAAFPIFLVGEFLGAIAWTRMMNSLAPGLGRWEHMRIFIVTHAARRIPGTVWHIVGRVAWYDRLGVPKRISTLGSVMETVLIIWSGLIIALAITPFTIGANSGLVGVLAAGILLSAALLHPRLLQAVLRRIGVHPEQDQITYGALLSWLAIYIALWLVGGTILYQMLLALWPVSPEMWAVSIGAWSLAGVTGMLIQLLPSGLGISEATLSLVLAAFVPSSIAVAAAIVMRVILTLFEFAVALLVYWASPAVPVRPKPKVKSG